jgi:catechol 2,3-dioxygenase-like lactoylglutathione lyase family enzyme
MSHDAPVNTMPTQSAGSLRPTPAVTVALDVADLRRCATFYADILGFRVARTEREGLPYEAIAMVSDRYPGIALFARKTFQRPVVGSTIGGVLQIGLRDPDLARRIGELEGRVTWVLPPAAPATPGADVTRVSFLDPDGYVVELFR